jgi:hypothetical protein
MNTTELSARREPQNRARDAYRHPYESLTFVLRELYHGPRSAYGRRSASLAQVIARHHLELHDGRRTRKETG